MIFVLFSMIYAYSFSQTCNSGYTLNLNGQNTLCEGASVNLLFNASSSPLQNNTTYLVTLSRSLNGIALADTTLGFTKNSNSNSHTLSYKIPYVPNSTSVVTHVMQIILLKKANNQTVCNQSGPTLTFYIAPRPIINPVPDTTVCSDQSIPARTLTSTIPTASYSWSRNNNIGLSNSSGITNTIPSFTANNTNSNPISSTFTVNASFNGCAALQSETFTITVKPKPSVTKPSDQTVCAGQPFNATSPFIGLPLNSTITYTWINSNPSIGLATSTGSSNSLPGFLAVNDTTIDVVSLFSITPSLNGCIGNTVTTTYRAKPVPTVNPTADSTICAGKSYPTLTFQGNISNGTNGLIYNWSTNDTTIGFSNLSGTNSILGFYGKNNGIIPVTARVIVIPNLNGCAGIPDTFIRTVKPLPRINSVPDKAECNGGQFSSVSLSATIAGSTITWTQSNPGGIGLNQLVGSDSIAGFPASNMGGISYIQSTFTVKAEYNGCIGPDSTILYTIYPTPTVDLIPDTTFCSNEQTTGFTFAGSSQNTTYNWRNANPLISQNPLPGTGQNSIPSFTTDIGPLSSTIVVTPQIANCFGDAIQFSVTVHPVPKLSAIPEQVVCNQDSTTAISLSQFQTVQGSSFSWVNNNPGIGGQTGNQDSTFIPAFIAQNDTNQITQGRFKITPFANGCKGDSSEFVISVKPTPEFSRFPNDTNLCNGQLYPGYSFTSTVGNTVINWSRNQSAVGSLVFSGGSFVPGFTTSIQGLQPVTTTIDIGLTANGCPGDNRSYSIQVLPPPEPAILDPLSNVCLGQTGLAVSTSTPALSYHWSVLTDSLVIQNKGGSNHALLFIPGQSSIDTILLKIVSINTESCVDSSIQKVGVLSSVVKPQADIILLPINNTFQCLDALSGITYQWGYDDRSTLEEIALAGEVFGDYVAGASLDTLRRNYWVKTSYPGDPCQLKSYFKFSLTGIDEELDINALLVYPNPATDKIFVSWKSTGEQVDVQVYDLNGREVYTHQSDKQDFDNMAEISTHEWSRGLYFLVLTSERGNISSRPFWLK